MQKYSENIPKIAKICKKICENILKTLRKYSENIAIPKILQKYYKLLQKYCKNNQKILRKICENIAENIMKLLWKYHENITKLTKNWGLADEKKSGL